MENTDDSGNIPPWWYPGYACLGITAGLVFCVLYKEYMPQTARLHLIMYIWLPLVVWVPIHMGIMAIVLVVNVDSSPF